MNPSRGLIALEQQLRVFVSAFAAGEDGAIHACQLDLAKGHLKITGRTTDVENPFFMAISADRRFLYSNHAPVEFGGDDEQVAAYEIDEHSGELRLLNRQPSFGSASCYVDVAASGRAVVVANYENGSLASYAVGDDGTLGETVSRIKHEGSSVDPNRQQGPHAHCAVVSPDGRFVLAADLGLDQVLCYRLHPATAELSPNEPAFARTAPGAGPRHLTFHPGGGFVYVINELDNTVAAFSYDAEYGTLKELQVISTLPEGYDGESHTADLKMTPDGQFLYGTNRGHDSIAIYRVSDDGRLSLLEFTPSLGEGPQNLAITPGGELLLCANMPGDNVVVFRIDSETGQLSTVGEPVPVIKPACIKIL